MFSLIGGLVLSAALVAHDAPPDVAGTWQVTIEAANERRPDGSNRSSTAIQGTLVLAQKGADITATWKSLDTWTLSGQVDETGAMRIASEPRDIPVTNNGKTGTVQARWIFQGTLKDGVLRGTAALEIADREPWFRPWSGRRK
jgi:hypothetical protein